MQIGLSKKVEEKLLKLISVFILFTALAYQLLQEIFIEMQSNQYVQNNLKHYRKKTRWSTISSTMKLHSSFKISETGALSTAPHPPQNSQKLKLYKHHTKSRSE